MKKSIFNVILISLLIISTIACAPVVTKSVEETMEEYRNVYRQGGPEALATYHSASRISSPPLSDSTLGLLLGLYTFSLIKSGGPAYYAPSYCTYLSPSAYCPPDVWAAWTPLERSLWIEYNLDLELSRYESRLKDINNMEMFKLQTEVQRLIDKINREKKD